MAKRKQLSKKTRFEVFKRDKFACQYCGLKAPEVVLQVDHISPVSKGGTNVLLNLITSCAACNGGKSDRTLDDASIVEKQRKQLAELQEKREQIEMMVQWQKGLARLDSHATDQALAFYTELVPGWAATTDAARADMDRAIRANSLPVVLDLLRSTAAKHLQHADGKVTEESARIIWETFVRACKWHKQNERDPVGSQLRYIRGILRNRVSYINDHRALDLLTEAHAAGVSLDELRSIAMGARTWSSWQLIMDDVVRDLAPAETES
jgi:hypothetical protein